MYIRSDHGSSRISQLILPILYIVLFILCCNRKSLVGEILRKNLLRAGFPAKRLSRETLFFFSIRIWHREPTLTPVILRSYLVFRVWLDLVPLSRPAPKECFTPRCPVNCCASTHFGENQLALGSSGISPLTTTHPLPSTYRRTHSRKGFIPRLALPLPLMLKLLLESELKGLGLQTLPTPESRLYLLGIHFSSANSLITRGS